MRRSIPSAELITKVYQLAHAVLGDKGAAFEVTKKAAQGWEVEFRAQRDRRRYQLGPDDFRQKLIMNKQLAPNFLTLKLCERAEKAQEEAGLAGLGPLPHESYFVIRYIKHLIYKTVQYRSFHVVVGVCRLVYDFSRKEATQIYEALVQDLRLRKDDQMHKDWKLSLLRGLHDKRFNGLLSLEEGPQGVKQFRRHEDQSQLAGAARQALTIFSPWGTSCRLAEKLTRRYSFDELRFAGGNPDAESRVEERRMYAAINPICFSRLLLLLGMGGEDDKLALPLFNLPVKTDTIPPTDFTNPPKLSEAQWMELVDYLNTGRRGRREKAGVLSVEVEGVERATIDPKERRDVQLRLEEDEDLVQVFLKRAGGNVLLGSLLLSSAGVAGDGSPWTGQVKLGWGRCISLTISPPPQDRYSTAGATLNLSYEEGSRVRSLLRRGRPAAGGPPTSARLAPARDANAAIFLPALLFAAFFAAAAVAVWLGYRSSMLGPQSADEQAARVPAPLASPEGPAPNKNANTVEGEKPNHTQAANSGEGHNGPAAGADGRNESGRVVNQSGKPAPRDRGTSRGKGAEHQPTPTPQPRGSRTGGVGDDGTITKRGEGVEAPPPREVTRGGRGSSGSGLPLRDVKIIYVEPPREPGAGGEFLRALVKGLESEAGVSVRPSAGGRNDVDAVFRWSVRRRGSKWTVSANLVNYNGTELWSEALTISAPDESSMSTEAARRLLDSLKAKQAQER